jgi:hypothetical protein
MSSFFFQASQSIRVKGKHILKKPSLIKHNCSNLMYHDKNSGILYDIFPAVNRKWTKIKRKSLTFILR